LHWLDMIAGINLSTVLTTDTNRLALSSTDNKPNCLYGLGVTQ
jgi:hypothetical protein